MEFLIPLLMFAFPVLIAILDKQAKKRKGVPQVKSRPIFPSAAGGSEGYPGKRPAAQDPSQPSGWAPPSYEAEGGYGFPGQLPKPADLPRGTENAASRTEEGSLPNRHQTSTLASEEGQRAIRREQKSAYEPETENPEPKLRIDKKNLILYSEILKPRFDA